MRILVVNEKNTIKKDYKGIGYDGGHQ